MPARLPGYEYDLFISYRQKDNKAGQWVTKFVQALRSELEATVKEDLSVYIDENANDGLLDTHNVDKSLEGKLKCLLFVPVLSQTYCDPKSFAWKQEFLAFNNFSSTDKLGPDIRLHSGNVSSRILPILIHELSPGDKASIEKELGRLRGIEFIFKSAGVNRPLMPDDNPDKNLNGTNYRDQINKLANSIRECLEALDHPLKPSKSETARRTLREDMVRSMAVLPFVNMSNDPEQEYFSDGISEEIINLLVQVPDLKVAGRTSSFSFKNRNEDLRYVGEKLGVRYILEGSVRKSGNRIRVTAQLIEVESGFHSWSQKFDRELKDIFDIQDEIASSIVNQLQVTLSQTGDLRERQQTSNVEAYQWYLKAMALFYRRGLAMFEGLRCFQAALAIDPEYALAHAGVADSYTMLCFHSLMMPEEAWPAAIVASEKALALGPDLAEAHCAAACIALLYERNWDKAEREFVHSLELNPLYLQARTWYSLFYLQVVKSNGSLALEHARLAVENDPISAYAQAVHCSVASLNALFEEAIAAGKKAIEYDPKSFNAWFLLGNAFHVSGSLNEALKCFHKALEVSERHSWALCGLLVTYRESNLMSEANEVYQELLGRYNAGQALPSLLSMSAAAIGLNEDAMKFAEEAFQRHDPYQVMTAINWPQGKYLYSIPGFDSIVSNLGLTKP